MLFHLVLQCCARFQTIPLPAFSVFISIVGSFLPTQLWEGENNSWGTADPGFVPNTHHCQRSSWALQLMSCGPGVATVAKVTVQCCLWDHHLESAFPSSSVDRSHSLAISARRARLSVGMDRATDKLVQRFGELCWAEMNLALAVSLGCSSSNS